MDKYHSGGLWSNSCCSHIYKNENWIEAINRCFDDELGISPKIHAICYGDVKIRDFKYIEESKAIYAGNFSYFSDYGIMKEHEIDYVFIVIPSENMIKNITPNPREVMEIRWVTISEIKQRYLQYSDEFTTWFEKEYLLFEKIDDL